MSDKIKIAVVGLGKMGLSHFSMVNAHPDVEAFACDASGFWVDVLSKNTKATYYKDYAKMLDEARLDAVVIATPSRAHDPMVRAALEKGLHVFCEKPFSLNWEEALRLAEMAESKSLVNQVGYHYRYVGAFREMKRLLDAGAIGTVTHVLAEAYGPVVLRENKKSWRTQKSEGGGCLYDYAAHPLNLLNWYFGEPARVSGSVLNSIYSKDIDDEVFSTLQFDGGPTAQLTVNWSDESHRKMTTRLSMIGTNGRLYADRQECQLYLREPIKGLDGYIKGLERQIHHRADRGSRGSICAARNIPTSWMILSAPCATANPHRARKRFPVRRDQPTRVDHDDTGLIMQVAPQVLKHLK